MLNPYQTKALLEKRVAELTEKAVTVSVKIEEAQLEYGQALLELAHAVQLLQQHNYALRERHKARATNKRVRSQIAAMRRAS